MGIKNVTTSVDVSKTVGEAQAILMRRGVSRVSTELDPGTGRVTGISFKMQTEFGPRDFSLPVRTEGVLRHMESDPSVPRSKCTPEQAERVAWRIAKEWLEVQGALIDAGIATQEEVFFAFMLTGDAEGKPHTVYETYLNNQKAIEP